MVNNTIEKLLRDGLSLIKEREYNNPSLDVQLILCHLLKKDKIYLFLHKDEVVDETTVKKFYEMAEKRNSGYPLQYMINSQEFMSLDFFVQEGVLIPRPDTETLVEKIIDIVNKGHLKDKEIKILDIGAGSGAIGLSLAYHLKNTRVTLIDISERAVETTMENIKRFKLDNASVVYGDIFEENKVFDSKYEIVVSNPPYIERSTISELQTEVSVYEPKTALDGGMDGLDFYRRIVHVFKGIHERDGILSVEIGSNQRQEVMKIFQDACIFKKIECNRDLYENDRLVTGFL